MDTEQRISLLYAEDDPQARTLLKKLLHLKFPGLTVYVAADGDQGMALYRKHLPQLVVTDIAMPVLDGIEMTKRIREVNPNAYVIAVTAYNDKEFCERSRDLGLNRCITKPVDFRTFLESIRDAIEYVREEKAALL